MLIVKRNQNRTRCRRLLLRSCSSSWWGHTPGHKGGPSEGPSVGHPACPTSRTAKGANATRTTQEAAVEEAFALRTAWDPSVTRTTVVVEISVDSPRPSSTTMFKTAREASATRTTQEALEDLEDSHLGNSGFPSTFFNNILPGKPVQTRTSFPVSKFCKKWKISYRLEKSFSYNKQLKMH